LEAGIVILRLMLRLGERGALRACCIKVPLKWWI
jgi:hypothetical protein